MALQADRVVCYVAEDEEGNYKVFSELPDSGVLCDDAPELEGAIEVHAVEAVPIDAELIFRTRVER